MTMLPRVAVDQFNAASAIADPQPGDLVFFANTYQRQYFARGHLHL
jgi:cell wall-associated NlpC family hydrolase